MRKIKTHNLFPLYSSQAVLVDRTMYISGQLGMDPASGQLVGGGVQAQTRQVDGWVWGVAIIINSIAYFLHCSGCDISTFGNSSCRPL